jgi:hypothetical protein
MFVTLVRWRLAAKMTGAHAVAGAFTPRQLNLGHCSVWTAWRLVLALDNGRHRW